MALARPHHSSSGGVTRFEVFLFSAAIGLAALFAASIVLTAINNAAFDQQFRAGKVDLDAPSIGLGSKGTPTYSGENLEIVPVNVNGLRDTPRSFTVTSNCVGLNMPKNTVGVKALTAAKETTITITVPERSVGTVLVCTESKARVQVILWAITE